MRKPLVAVRERALAEGVMGMALLDEVLNNPLSQKDPDGHRTECGAETSTTDPITGTVTVHANCHETSDWFRGILRWIGNHPKTMQTSFAVVNGATLVSSVLDGGTSLAAVPEELTGEAALLEAGEIAAEEGAEVAGENAGQAASEKQALRVAKQIEKDLGKEARRDFHDMKQSGESDRTMQQLKQDARAVYEDHGKTPPGWLK